MEDMMRLRAYAEEQRAIVRTTADLWECVIRYGLAARYDELLARREFLASHPRPSLTSH